MSLSIRVLRTNLKKTKQMGLFLYEFNLISVFMNDAKIWKKKQQIFFFSLNVDAKVSNGHERPSKCPNFTVRPSEKNSNSQISNIWMDCVEEEVDDVSLRISNIRTFLFRTDGRTDKILSVWHLCMDERILQSS